MAINPQEYEKFLGHAFVTRQNTVALAIGERHWTRWELANVFGLPHFRSAGTLTTYLRKAGVKTLEELYALSPDELAHVKGLGETATYVAMSVLKNENFDTRHWSGLDEKGGTVTFRTLKNRALRRSASKRPTHGVRRVAKARGLHASM